MRNLALLFANVQMLKVVPIALTVIYAPGRVFIHMLGVLLGKLGVK